MPAKVFKDSITYYANTKRLWNLGILPLRGKEIQRIVEFQRMTHKLHTEFDYMFNVKKANV